MSDKPNRKALFPELRAAEYDRLEYVLKPAPGTTLDEMKNPEYWASVASYLKPYTRIEVRPADGSWWAELLVRVVEPFRAKVHVLRSVEFEPRAAADSPLAVVDGYEIKWRGPQNKYAAISLSDKAILKEGFESKDVAALWLRNHVAVLAA